MTNSRRGLAGRLLGYLNERFPIQGVITNSIAYAAALLYGKAIVGDGELHVAVEDVLGVLGILGYLLLARVFDEHKDFEFDVEHLPDRPLPRGSISWREVDGLGVAAFVVQAAVSVAVDGGVGPVCFWWAIALTYLVITRFEFFIRPWLRRHFVTNTVLHLPVYALGLVWIAQIGAEPEWVGTDVLWLAAYVYVATLGIDLWRKSHGPEDEREAVDSYTQRWGVTGASAMTAAVAVVCAALAAVMLTVADAEAPAGYAALAWLPVPLFVGLVRFVGAPSRRTNKPKRDLLAATLVGFNLILALTLAIDRGLA
ncbi:MAG TPA: hypothetical protein VF712_06725 [Thermoleophilaceae bacterium]|jgi:4-hydroxybenzoate polyprenyltransferase